MLDRVSTGILSLDGQGGSQIYADYWQWEQAQITQKQPKTEKPAAAKPTPAGKKKLSYLEAREWEGMEARILEAEQALEAIRAEMHAPDVVFRRRAFARLLPAIAGLPRRRSRSFMRGGRNWKRSATVGAGAPLSATRLPGIAIISLQGANL